MPACVACHQGRYADRVKRCEKLYAAGKSRCFQWFVVRPKEFDDSHDGLMLVSLLSFVRRGSGRGGQVDAPVTHDLFEFEEFCLDRRSGGLFRRDAAGGLTSVPIGSRALDVLGVLVSRPGELLSKQAIMQAVWPRIVVDDKNLAVQVATLRRVLDNGRADRSCIQTEAGRGYRFVVPVTRIRQDGFPAANLPVPASPDVASPPTVHAPSSATQSQRAHRAVGALAAVGVLVVGALLALAWTGGWIGAGKTLPPRLSMVVLPFQDMDDDPTNDYLADAITDDLTTELSRISGAWVIARESAYTYKGKTTDVRQIGRELGVRYVLEGSVRKIGSILRVNVQLVSAETGAHLWSDRFDEEITQLAAGQQRIVERLSDPVGISMVAIEGARGLRERPTNPDAFDLILQARSLNQRPPTPQRDKEMLALYERALLLDPQSAYAMAMVAYFLTEAGGNNLENLQRAGRLLEHARAREPRSAKVLEIAVYWLRSVGRCAEAIEAAEHAIRTDSNQIRSYTGVYNELAVCKTRVGHAEEELALQAQVDQLNPRSVYKTSRFRHMGFAALMLGRDQDAIAHFQRSLALLPENPAHRWTYRMLAAAYARIGQMDEAKRALSEGDRLWPYFTIREVFPEELSSPVYVQQIRNYQATLRLAGARDHADENADFGVPPDGSLRSELTGRTPTDAPGVKTIRTAELVAFLADAQPLIIDTVSYSWGRSIPGAIGLKFSGAGGNFHDEAQDRLRRKMIELTGGDLNRAVVAVGWNSERFAGRNLALRLAALGYAQVYWYRGGREAWEVAELPETELAVQEW
jgi:TolB-like protein/DNA-binding winged helix-turn-helix (wHTH) protein